LICKFLGTQDYSEVLIAMQQFTKNRNESTIDELWFLEHYPVFTQGYAGKDEHILEDIKFIRTDRGGQVTYHGPGQLIVYLLLNLNKQAINLKKLIYILSSSIIELLSKYNIISNTIDDAPGVYINNKKICSIGLKIYRNCTYHGLSLNIDMDLKPFNKINPCGNPNLTMTQLSDFVKNINIKSVAMLLSEILVNKLNEK
jgi:lipoyl(octanoyl) transferase